MAREIASWLSGPQPDYESGDYPGRRLGMPEDGPGSIARFGRRTAALLIDWLIGYGLAALAMAVGLVSLPALSTTVLAVWFVLGVVSVRLFGFSPGQFVMGLMVVPVDNRDHVGLGRAIGRGLLIATVVPPLFTDTDLRGLQDRGTATAVVRR
ncbi:RDD family protein [Mycobacterium hackensackense]|uniref:RDD family protein n=1 Tax=Mycobacterium hackensackense TaxID=228909 RepID=UPI002265EBA0|nr:RDD family protein [Mycobacterium hackensackense]MCV7254573.1 RDD family protein [Mycobacterium hackensackense]